MVVTFKIITLAASLEEKTINLFDDHFHDSGSIHVEGARIKCWKSGGHGSETFLEVVENSCNPVVKQEILWLFKNQRWWELKHHLFCSNTF